MSSFTERILDPIKLPKNPERFFFEKQEKYGELFPIYLPQTPTTFFSGSQRAAEEIFKAPINTFHPDNKSNPISPIVGDNSLILLGGEKHKNEKRMMHPFFHGSSLLQNTKIIMEVINEELNNLKNKSKQNQLLNTMQEISLHIIIAAAFGVKERKARLKLRSVILKYVNSYSQLLMFVPQSRNKLFGIGPWDRFIKERNKFDKAIVDLLKSGHDDSSLLAKFKELYLHNQDSSNHNLVIDQLKTILIAGHETTAITLFWAIYYIGQDKQIYNKLKDLTCDKSIEELLDDPFLHAVCNESMRMHPAVPIILRSLVTDYEFMGKHMKKGQNIGLALTLLHHDKNIYLEPHLFKPERFLDCQYQATQFAPFGGSNRKCIGHSFAYLEIKLFLITIFKESEFKIQIQQSISPIIRGVTMCPSKDLPFDVF